MNLELRKKPVRSAMVYLVFAASGATALVYQVIWARWLGLILGNTTTSISIVLGSFMLGLALGSWIAGRLLCRIKNPMSAYALMEVAIGLFALGFPFLLRGVDGLFSIFVNADSPALASLAARSVFAFVLLLVPTTCMGATLPLLTDYFRRSPRYSESWKVGLLYAANTLGAAVGIAAASYFLIELIGVSATTALAAGFNFLIALLGYRFSRRSDLLPLESVKGSPGPRALNSLETISLVVLAATGAAALASEVLWTRALETAIGNSTYAFATIVLVYLVGIAVGSWMMSLVVVRLKNLSWWLAALPSAMGAWMLFAVFLYMSALEEFAIYSGQLVSLSVLFSNYLKAVSILLPLSMLSGACFPIATRLMEPDHKDARGTVIARAYFWNTAGAVAGSLIAGFAVAPIFDYFGALFVLVVIYAAVGAAAGLWIAAARRTAARKSAAFGVLGLASLGLAVLGLAMIAKEEGFSGRYNDRHPEREVVFHEPGLQGVTSVIKRKDQPLAEMLLVNGQGMTLKVTDTKMMAHLPMLLHPDPRDTLVICFGMGTTYRSAISHGKNVTVIELVSEVFEAFDHFYADSERVRRYPQGRMLINDGRNFLNLVQDRYDVITIDPPPPIDAAGVNHLYSKEFIELARSRLKPGGIMAHWVPTIWAQPEVNDGKTFQMLVQTFASVFPYAYQQLGHAGVGMHLIGSAEPISLSMEDLEVRLAREEVRQDLREWDPVSPTSFLGLKKIDPPNEALRLVTDDHPLLEFFLLRTWASGGKKRFARNFW